MFLIPALAAAFLIILPGEVRAAAGGIQSCTASSICVIGEFLYDDTSAPINNATCTIVSYDPNDAEFLNTSMSTPTQSDGWYSKSFAAPATTGLYRTTVSCVVSGDTLTIDKSFEVVAAASTPASSSDIASAVWGYSTRTVSSFGTLIADIWANATRTLTGADLTSGKLASQSDITAVSDKVANIQTTSTNVTNVTNNISEIKNVTEETRLLLEQVVNKPVIENVLEEEVPDLSEKIKGTKAVAKSFYVNNQLLTSESASLASKWGSLPGSAALEKVIALGETIGEPSDSSSTNTMFGAANWMRDSWNWEEGRQAYAQLTTAYGLMTKVKEGLADYKKTPTQLADLKTLAKTSLALEKTYPALTSKIETTEKLAASLGTKNDQIDKALKSKNPQNLAGLKNQVMALNKVPGVLGALNTKSDKNFLLGLKGIINTNIKLLASKSGRSLINVWIEEGSMIFKTIVTNPSTLVSQEVEIKYYLPSELKEEDVLEKDAGLEVKYDSEKNQLYVAGKFTLAAGATRTFSVRANDVWDLTMAEIESMRNETAELYKPLEKTAYFAQGVSLKSDINASLDKMASLMDGAIIPEQKIKAYREADILKESVAQKIAGMRDLVTQASAGGSLLGFVGGAQTIGVWGIVIIIAAGFVFMSIYMKTMLNHNSQPLKVVPYKVPAVKLVVIMLLSSAMSAAATGIIVSKIVSEDYEEQIMILGAKSEVSEKEHPLEKDVPLETEEDLGIGGLYLVIVGDTPTGFLKVRETPGGAEIGKVNPGDKLIYLDENDGWYQVKLESGETGWVSKEYSTKE